METSFNDAKGDAKIEGLFNAMTVDGREVELQTLIERLHAAGIMDQRDHRLKAMKTIMAEIGGRGKCFYGVKLDLPGFTRMIDVNRPLMMRALVDGLVIPNFGDFIKKTEYLYEQQKTNVSGDLREENCPLQKIDPDTWGMAVCTIDGQRCFFGDSEVPFAMKGLAKPLVTAYALKKRGFLEVEQYVGHYGTHETCDLLCFDETRKPINPMVKSGYIALCSLLFGMDKKECMAGELHDFTNFLLDLVAFELCQMNTHQIMNEKQYGHQAQSIAHFLKSLHVLPEKCNTDLGLDLYYQCNATEVNCESLSVIAATLANAGINPLTGAKLIQDEHVKYILSVMFSSGLGAYSGTAAVTIGQPSKSSNSGGLMLVIPGLLGLAVFSPKLDENGISVRALAFVEMFINQMGYHPYQHLSDRLKRKFPTRQIVVTQCNQWCPLFSAVANGDFTAVLKLTNDNPEAAFVRDSYKRNALHVAVAQNQVEISKYICEKFTPLTIEKDKWGRRPCSYANATNYQLIAKLKEWEALMSGEGGGDAKKSGRSDRRSYKAMEK